MENQEKSLVVIKKITDVSRFLKSEASAEQKKMVVEIFLIELIRSIEKYFSKASLQLYQLMNKPLPLVPENIELKKKREKLERKEKRMSSKKYKERFMITWYKEWDEERNYPLRKLDDAYWKEMEKVWGQIEAIKQEEEAETERQILKAAQKEIDDLLDDTLSHIKATIENGENGADDVDDANIKALKHIIQIATAEYLSSFIKRACQILVLQVKKTGKWATRSLALAKSLLSLREKIDGLVAHMDAGISIAFYDLILGVELFLAEINNSIIEREKQERSQRVFLATIEAGFQKVVSQIASVENGLKNELKTINRNVVGVNRELSSLVALNEKIIEQIKENGSLINSLGTKLDGISDKLSSVEDAVFYIAFPDDK